MVLNKNKRIGNVIYIVEGVKDEIGLLSIIFTRIFDYTTVSYDKRNNYIRLNNDRDKYSNVFLIPAEHSAISRFNTEEEYYYCIYNRLSKYGLDVENSAIYYLFDRDRLSNRPGSIFKNIMKYKNSRDNGIEINGLFSLSYTSIEAYYYLCNEDERNFASGKEAKEHLKDIDMNVDDIKLMRGIEELLKYFLKKQIHFNLEYLDDFSITNEEVLKNEESFYSENQCYETVSLLFISLLDLVIINLDD
jgi:hypothetical protein